MISRGVLSWNGAADSSHFWTHAVCAQVHCINSLSQLLPLHGSGGPVRGGFSVFQFTLRKGKKTLVDSQALVLSPVSKACSSPDTCLAHGYCGNDGSALGLGYQLSGYWLPLVQFHCYNNLHQLLFQPRAPYMQEGVWRGSSIWWPRSCLFPLHVQNVLIFSSTYPEIVSKIDSEFGLE